MKRWQFWLLGWIYLLEGLMLLISLGYWTSNMSFAFVFWATMYNHDRKMKLTGAKP